MTAFRLPAKTPTEQVIVTFDFTGETPDDATLSSGSVLISVASGDDPAVSLVKGAITYNGRSLLVVISGGVAGCVYLLYVSVHSSDGQVLERQATIRISAQAA